MLTIHLLGAGQASYLDRPLVGFPTQQPYLLLCYLLLYRRRPHPRERLAAVFWADCTTAISRKCLRNALWRLREELQHAGAPADRYIGVSGEFVSFLDSGPHWLDIEAFESPIQACRDLSSHTLKPGQVRELQEAVALYTGDLLETVYEDWCLQERERLRLLHTSALSKLMDYHTLHGAHEAGLECGHKILALDNTREGVHRRMMQLYWLSGDRCAALGQYHRCAQILREELRIAPSEQTRQMYEQMKSGQCRPADWLQPQPVSASASPTDNTDNATEPQLHQALHRLHQLEALVREISAELIAIEGLVGAEFGDNCST